MWSRAWNCCDPRSTRTRSCMAVVSTENVPVKTEPDVVAVRRRVREVASQLGLSLVDQTKLITAASELALRDGFTTGSGLGLGLGGSKRLVNEFDIVSYPGSGTKITITRWK